MALGDPYASLGDIKNYLKLPVDNTTYDAALTDALLSASGDVDKHCGRQFNLDADPPSPRVFEPEGDWVTCRTDDFASATGLVVMLDTGGTGTFSTTVDPANFELYPYNGLSDGVPWPYTKIRLFDGSLFPRVSWRRRGVVQVTAQWGWPSVPAPIKQATLIIAAQKYKLADAPWGVAGMTEFGTAVRVREIPLVKETLVPYIRYPVLGG